VEVVLWVQRSIDTKPYDWRHTIMPPKIGQGLWRPSEMPIPANYGPRIRPVENWALTFDPADPATWRSGAGRAALEASEADDWQRLRAVIAATPFVKVR
jgi:hypothetical protein